MARQFGGTWWGKAWIDALEQRAGLDSNRLARGRTYARQDRVARIEVDSGRVTALVRGTRVLPYRVTVGIRTFDDDTWGRLTTAIASRAGHAAALLDGEIPPEVVADATAAGVELLPGSGDLLPRCSCPDFADPCKHAAAVCYLVADALDRDPFVLFVLRGRDRTALMAEVRSRRQQPDGAGGGSPRSGEGGALVDPGVPARQAWQAWKEASAAERQATSTALDLPDEPGAPAQWPADPPADAPFTADGLRRLAADAAQRAWSQLVDGTTSGLRLSEGADLARRASATEDAGEPLTELARAAGELPTALAHRAALWRHAGPDQVETVDESLWRPPDTALEAGLVALEEAGVDRARIQVRSNRLTIGDVQLRITADGRWWRYEKHGRQWDLVEAPSSDPGDLVGGTD